MSLTRFKWATGGKLSDWSIRNEKNNQKEQVPF
jgi:hypothetical protein